MNRITFKRSKGTANPMSKFSDAVIADIRKDIANGVSLDDVSKKYGVSKGYASLLGSKKSVYRK